MNHTEAREIIKRAFASVFMREPTRSEAQCVQAVGSIETSYGRGWKGAGKDSHNWGAIQRVKHTPENSFEYVDTHPNADGTSTTYRAWFAKYPSDVDGAADLVRKVYKDRPSVLACATAGDVYGVSAALRDTGYYEGWGRNREERIAHHHSALMREIREMCIELGEPLPAGGEPPIPTMRRGSKGEHVKAWQRIIRVAADGIFGPETERVTREWQKAHGLVADGVVGPKTRSKAGLGDMDP